jgi:UDP-N-acetylglucosamine 1-carboxyvinyltransferase
MAADGETVISNGYYINRGHTSIGERLRALGADVSAEEDEVG